MSSSAVADAKAKLDEEEKKLALLQKEYNDITRKIDEIRKQVQGLVNNDVITLASTAAPTPIPQKANTPADIAVKAAHSYEAIETWVKAKIREPNMISQRDIGTEEVNTYPVGNLRGIPDKKGIDDNLLPDLQLSGGTANYQTMQTSGNDNDCLIHAILTALSPSFRRLTKVGKDAIVTYFRRNILVDIYNTLIAQRVAADETNNMEFYNSLRDLQIDINLDTHIAGQFGLWYKIGVFVRDRDKPQTKWNLEGEDKGDTPYIMIYNPGRNHFEAVRFNPTKENPNGIYIFNKSNIQSWIDSKETIDLKQTRGQCQINGKEVLKRDKVSYNNSKYTVIESKNKDDGSGCEYIYAVKGDNILLAEINLKTFKEEKGKRLGGPLYYQAVQTNPELEAQFRLTDQELSSIGIINLAQHVNECRIIE